jgi:hypothetical protein
MVFLSVGLKHHETTVRIKSNNAGNISLVGSPIANKTGPTRLGFAVLLKFFQYAARFPLSMQEVPATAVAYIARQVGVPAEEFLRYDWEGRAVKYHRAQIRAFLGFREPTVQDAEELAGWLSEYVLPQGHPDEHVNAAAYQRLRDLGIEPPTPDRLERVLASASACTGWARTPD